jgi:hypothetical protein
MNIDFATWNQSHDTKQTDDTTDEEFVLGEINFDTSSCDDDEEEYIPRLRKSTYSIIRRRYIPSGRLYHDGSFKKSVKLDDNGETMATNLTFEQSEMIMLNEYLASHDIKRRKFSSFSELVKAIGESETLTYDSFSAGAYQYSRVCSL